MKFVAIILFTFLTPWISLAKCDVKVKQMTLINAVGIVDWDHKNNQIVRSYPEIDHFGPELPDKIHLKVELEGDCSKSAEILVHIYGYRAVYRMMGGEMEHSLHGAVPEGQWTSSLGTYSTQSESFSQSSTIELKDIDMKKIWDSVDEFFWYWRINFKVYLKIDQDEYLIGERMIPSPLIH